MAKVLRNQLIVHGRATGYTGIHARAGKPKAKTDDELEKHEDACMCRTCVSALIDQQVTAAVAKAITEALAAATGDDAGKRRPAAHSTTPLTVHRGALSDPPPTGEPEPERNGYGRPLLPGVIRPRKAS